MHLVGRVSIKVEASKAKTPFKRGYERGRPGMIRQAKLKPSSRGGKKGVLS